MTVKISKPAVNLREELADLKKPTGIAGEAMLRAETPQEQFQLIGAGRRNWVINGDIQVSQRGTFSSATASSHNGYTVDRWKTTTVGVNATVQKQSVTLPNGWEANSTKTAASTTASSGAYIGQNQTIEDGQRILRSGGTWTVSAWIKTNRNDVVIRLGGVKNVGEPAVGDGQWHYYSVTFEYTTGGSGDQGIGFLTYDNGSTAITTGDYIEFTQFQLELGKVATPFEHRSYGEELALCQRYYYRIQNEISDNGFFAVGQVRDATRAYAVIHLPVSMRTYPQEMDQTGTATDYAVWHGNNVTTNCSSVPLIQGSTKNTARVVFTIASGLTTGQACSFRPKNDSSFLAFSAEL